MATYPSPYSYLRQVSSSGGHAEIFSPEFRALGPGLVTSIHPTFIAFTGTLS